MRMQDSARTPAAKARKLVLRFLRPSSFKIGCLVTFLLLPLHPEPEPAK